MPLITAPGAYPDIPAEDYHGNADLLPGPSLSSTGAKTILNQSPLHFWHASPMNPDRPAEDDAPHFSIGKAAHDRILLRDRWPEFYHVLPEGFSRAATKKWANAIGEAEAAAEAGKVILRSQDADIVEAVVDAVDRNPLARTALSNGVTEETLVWQDPLTGVWLRARPDFRPNSIAQCLDVRVVADLKFVAPTNATPSGFARAMAQFGYHQSAAFYSDGIKAVFGVYPTHWLHVVVEKEAPFSVSLYQLPGEDIERGRVLNRRAIDLFARCLERNEWPGYADNPRLCGLPAWERNRIDNTDFNEVALAAAA